jgi:REP element-mobilizing transposase RayT
MDRFQGKYRIPSARLPGWDYASAGYYFVTIVTHGRIPYFGEILAGKMHLSPIGAIVAEEWSKTPQIRPNIQLDEWVIMPNHLHGIIIITTVETPRRGVSTERRGVSTKAWKPNTLGSILNQFKSVCTKRIRLACNPDFGWQPRFHDHIIRDEKSLERIRAYIRYNPLQWSQDGENPDRAKGRLP